MEIHTGITLCHATKLKSAIVTLSPTRYLFPSNAVSSTPRIRLTSFLYLEIAEGSFSRCACVNQTPVFHYSSIWNDDRKEGGVGGATYLDRSRRLAQKLGTSTTDSGDIFLDQGCKSSDCLCRIFRSSTGLLPLTNYLSASPTTNPQSMAWVNPMKSKVNKPYLPKHKPIIIIVNNHRRASIRVQVRERRFLDWEHVK